MKLRIVLLVWKTTLFINELQLKNQYTHFEKKNFNIDVKLLLFKKISSTQNTYTKYYNKESFLDFVKTKILDKNTKFK